MVPRGIGKSNPTTLLTVSPESMLCFGASPALLCPILPSAMHRLCAFPLYQPGSCVQCAYLGNNFPPRIFHYKIPLTREIWHADMESILPKLQVIIVN